MTVQLGVKKLEGKRESFLAESSIHKIVLVNATASLGLPNVCSGSLHMRPLKAIMKPKLCLSNSKARVILGNYTSHQLGPADEKHWFATSVPSHNFFLFHLFFLFIDFHCGQGEELEGRAG